MHISLSADTLFTAWGFPVTNSLLTTWVVMAMLIIAALIIRWRVTLVPGKVQNAIEMVFEYLLALIEQMLGSRSVALKYFPLIATIFIFIFTANMLNFLPIFGTVGIPHEGSLTPLFRPVNADLNVTLALAIICFLVIELSGILTLGLFK